MIRNSIDHLILGFLFLFIGMLSILIFLPRRKQPVYFSLSFGLFAICFGILEIGGYGRDISQLLFDVPIVLDYLTYIAAYLIPAALYASVEQIYGAGYKAIIRRLWQFHLVATILVVILDLINAVPIERTQMLFGMLIIPEIVIVVTCCIKASSKDNVEVKIFSLGFSLLALFVLHDLFAALGLLPKWHAIFPWGVFLFILILGYILYRRFVQAHLALQELQDAHEMQMSLMPEDTPPVSEVEIAGRCLPANTVGGDYFNYIRLDEEQSKLGIVLMDVTGHGMKAATTGFVANGMLQAEIHSGTKLEHIMAQMNQSLCYTLQKNTFVAMSLSLIDTSAKVLTHFNAGIPEPVIIRNGDLIPLETPGAFPLGCWLESEYTATVISLQSADLLVFHSDGILEARNKADEMYVDNRFAAFLKALDTQALSATKIVAEILNDVRAFDKEGNDDMTVVVTKVL
jgi:hypothetical protein